MVLTHEEHDEFIKNPEKQEEIIRKAKNRFKYLGRWAKCSGENIK